MNETKRNEIYEECSNAKRYCIIMEFICDISKVLASLELKSICFEVCIN